LTLCERAPILFSFCVFQVRFCALRLSRRFGTTRADDGATTCSDGRGAVWYWASPVPQSRVPALTKFSLYPKLSPKLTCLHFVVALQKLSRRQRSFESIFPSIEPDMADRFRVVLSRDFTSSDEEVDETDAEGALRVRTLPWESEHVRQIKARLDEVYVKQFASEKQRALIGRTVRDPQVLSSRLCPEGSPAWTVRQRSGSAEARLPH